MVSLSTIFESNAKISTSLPPGLIAVFAGATSGIGESTLKTFVKYASKPRIYLLARSTTSGERLIKECQEINADAEVNLILVDLSSIRETDRACEEVKKKENEINVVFLSAGEIVMGKKTTPEGLNFFLAAAYYSKIRIIQSLLPLLKSATSFSRVVTVVAGGYEGAIDTSDFAGMHISLAKLRPHLTAMLTLSLEKLATQAPTVSFIHDFPGAVKTPLFDDLGGIYAVLALILKGWMWIGTVLGVKGFVSVEDSGERHVFLATSEAFKAKEGMSNGVPLEEGFGVKRGTDGVLGSGVYSVGLTCESALPKVEKVLDGHRKKEINEQVWKHTAGEIDRIMGYHQEFDLGYL